MIKKFCTKCGREFEATGREVICPACKAQAAEETKRAAVLRAKRASWAGESVPVRISGRASTVIRHYGTANSLPFAEALDALLKATPFFQALDTAWADVTPYKSHRRDKSTAETTQDTQTDTPQDVPQASKAQDKAQDVQDVPQEVKVAQAAKASKPSTAAKKAAAK